MVIALPDGFPDLVAAAIEDWADELPKKNSDIWDALLYPIFLGENVRSAQAAYVKEVLDPFLTMNKAQRAGSDPHWSDGILKAIDIEMRAIRGTAGGGLKKAILGIVQKDVKSLDLGRTVYDAFQFFKAYNVNVQKIKQIRNDRDATGDLLAHADKEIHDVGLTKAVLWLYDCGIADDFAPPNAQNRRFLTECGYSGFEWSRYGMAEDWVIFAPLCQRMREVANLVSKKLRKPVTVKQAQTAAWYLQTCRGPPGIWRRGGRLTPRVLLNFLESRGWDIDDLTDRLGDVERLEDLGEELRSFLRP